MGVQTTTNARDKLALLTGHRQMQNHTKGEKYNMGLYGKRRRPYKKREARDAKIVKGPGKAKKRKFSTKKAEPVKEPELKRVVMFKK